MSRPILSQNIAYIYPFINIIILNKNLTIRLIFQYLLKSYVYILIVIILHLETHLTFS